MHMHEHTNTNIKIQPLKLLLLLVFSPWAGLGRDQSSVRWLVCCILGKFLGVACHCFPPLWN